MTTNLQQRFEEKYNLKGGGEIIYRPSSGFQSYNIEHGLLAFIKAELLALAEEVEQTNEPNKTGMQKDIVIYNSGFRNALSDAATIIRNRANEISG